MFDTALSRRRLLHLLGSLAPLAALPLSPMPALSAENEKLGIAFIGDSMVDGVYGGMLRTITQDHCLASHFRLGRFGENGTGLTRPSKFDWIGEAKDVVARFKPALVVVSLGLNDRQSIVDKKRARFDLGTPGWRKRYGELVAELAQDAKDVPGGLIWLGLPVLRDKVSQDDAAEKNTIFESAMKGLNDPRFTYAEPWKPVGANTFQPYGENTKGDRVHIRAGDGIHFTSMGYDLIAQYLLPKVIAQLQAQKVPVATSC